MILSDREIRAAMERGSIRISPPPRPEAMVSTAVDLTLDSEIHVWEALEDIGEAITFRPGGPNFNATALIERYAKRQTIGPGGLITRPGSFLLGWTVEKIQLPSSSRIAARVEGKSSLARLGLGVHVTAPTIHAGFGYKKIDPSYVGSPIRLEIWNVGKVPIELLCGMAICQLIFEEVHGTPDRGYEGKFSVQGPK